MSCFVMNTKAIARIASFLCECFETWSNNEGEIKERLHRAATYVSVKKENSAFMDMPTRWQGGAPNAITKPRMAAILYALNLEAYHIRYGGQFEPDLDECEKMFENVPFENVPVSISGHGEIDKYTFDYLARMVKTIECYTYQCSEYEQYPNHNIQLDAICHAICHLIMEHTCKGYKQQRWGE